MHTLLMLTLGLFMLLCCVLLGDLWPLNKTARDKALVAFIPIWCLISLLNMTVGVIKGFPLVFEAGIFILVCLPPCLIAYFLLRRAK